MSGLLTLLDSIGAASFALFWVPLAVWTLVWLAAEVATRWAPIPAVAYRLGQAALLSLPAGLVLAAWIDPSAWPIWESSSVAVELPRWAMSATAADGPASTPSLHVSGPTALGLATVLAALSAAVGVGRLASQTLALRRLRKALPTVEVPGLGAEADRVASQVGLRMPVRVVATSASVVPMTLGVIRPTVVIPAGLSAADRRLVLAHEFVHVRQLDPLLHAAEAVVVALFGLHPGVRRLARACSLNREMACDAALLADPRISRHSYASLVSSVAASATVRSPAPALHMAGRPSHIHQRLIAMTRPTPTPAPRLAGLLAVLVLATGTLLTTAGRAVAQPADPVTIEGPTDPVIFVDGERVEGTIEELGIDPNDIYSIEVFKEDAAQSRFGEDAVILITTKAAAEASGLPPAPEADESGAAPRPPQPPAPANGQIIIRDSSGASVSVAGRTQRPSTRSEATAPLIVVDGVVADQERMEGLDPDAIASVEVVKSPSAAQLEEYGPAAANGLVFVTTRD